jgi:hypothetical protein
MSKEEENSTEEPAAACSCSSEACSSCAFGAQSCLFQELYNSTKDDQLVQFFRSIFTWENKTRSAACFIASNAFFIMTVKYNFSVLSLVAYFVAISILIGFIFSYGTRCFYKYVKNSEEEIDPFAYSIFLFSNTIFSNC